MDRGRLALCDSPLIKLPVIINHSTCFSFESLLLYIVANHPAGTEISVLTARQEKKQNKQLSFWWKDYCSIISRLLGHTQ